ncbi:MAG TPA: dTDP-4-amino-4,6-dideoxygalactose transaminase, partial [Flavobacterium sp.]|nr:dTDP-4-amino-4,6-dideoxygalactose transaminase [Flavobacterium sp.]
LVTIGHLSAFSFHETKNIISGEGGLLGINDENFIERSEIIWEKGTNRSQFFRGEINKYGWGDTGSSFLPSEIIAAFLWAQIENLQDIQNKRRLLWNTYYDAFKELNLKGVHLPNIPKYATNNAHMFYLVFDKPQNRTSFINRLKADEINPVFHYISLHSSDFYASKHDGRQLLNADNFTECLVRMPLYYELTTNDIDKMCTLLKQHY